MDGNGSWRDNVFVERVWRSIKYEEVYLKAYESVGDAGRSIGEYIDLHNRKRPVRSWRIRRRRGRLRDAACDQIGSLIAPAVPLKNLGKLSERARSPLSPPMLAGLAS